MAMTDRMKELYESAIKNRAFIVDAKDADNDSPPSEHSDNQDKVIYAVIYYGWLVGKHGRYWRDYL
jgi:hypothetical protein